MALANLALVVAVEGTAKAAAESRAMIGGTIALVLARCLSRHATAFPAILPATLTLLEHDDGNPAAVHDFGGTVFGAVGLIAFALVAAMIFGYVPAWGALALAGWTVVSLVLYVLRSTERLPLPAGIQGSRARTVIGDTPEPGQGGPSYRPPR